MKPERILVVDDERDIRTVVGMALTMVGGFVVEECALGEDAVRQATAFGPDLILLDVMMPGLDGPSTLRQLRQSPRTADTPVIFMTAKIMPGEVEHYREIGAVGVIAKPFDPMALSDEILKICEGL